MGHTGTGPAGSSNAGAPWPPMSGQSAFPNVESLMVDVGLNHPTLLKAWVQTNYGMEATDEDGWFICEPLRIVFAHHVGIHNVVLWPKTKHKCRLITLDKATITLFEFQQYVNTVLVYRENQEFPIPARKYDSVGYDLYCTEAGIIAPKQMKDISTGVYLSLPVHIWVMLINRSSTFRKGVTMPTSIIDPGFQGELKICTYNTNDVPFYYKIGDRLGQFIPMMDVSGINLQEVASRDDFPDTERGAKGFGSTGI